MQVSGSVQQRVLKKVFIRLFLAAFITSLLEQLTHLVDNTVASSTIGAGAIGALGLFSPVDSVLNIVIFTISIGLSAMAARFLARGEIEKLKKSLTSSLLLMAFFALVLCVLILLNSYSLLHLLGTEGELWPLASSYLPVYAFCLIPFGLHPLLSQFLVLDNKEHLSVAGTVLLLVMTAFFEWWFVIVLGWNMFGLGLGSGLAYVVSDLFLFGCLFLKGSSLRPAAGILDGRDISQLLQFGFSSGFKTGINALLQISFNRILLGLLSVAALSSYSIVMGFYSYILCAVSAIAGVAFSLGSALLFDQDSDSLSSLIQIQLKYGLLITGGSVLLLFLLASPLASFYSAGDPQVYAISVSGFRMICLALLLAFLTEIPLAYITIQNRNGFLVFFNLFGNLVFPVAILYGSCRMWGTQGMWMTIILVNLVQLLLVCGYQLYAGKKIPAKLVSLFFPNAFGQIDPASVLDTTLISQEQVLGLSLKVEEFARKHHFSTRLARKAALSVEEMAGNVVQHGFSDQKSHSLDIRIQAKKDKLLLRLRDDCRPFDPKQQAAVFQNEDPFKNIGIKMIVKIADHMSYQKLYGLNVTTITLQEKSS